MKRVTTVIAALLVLAAGGVGAWLVLGDEDDDSPPAPTTTQAIAPPARKHPPRLHLPQHGHPLVWVRHGQEVALHTSPHGPVVHRVGDETKFGEPMVFSVSKQRGQWIGAPTPYLGNHALAWIRLDPTLLKAGATPYSIVIDLSEFRGRLVRNHKTRRSFAVTVGAPGTETPTGHFATTDEFVGTLNSAAYGCCALALTARQDHLLSGWMGGDRIAIHGTTGPLGVAASHGCIRAANPDVRALHRLTPLGTPVIVKN